MTRRLLFGVLALVLAVVNVQIARKELLVRGGRPVLLELAPRDPRSLMQGDYMVLNYRVINELWRIYPKQDGRVVLDVDGAGVGRFVRIHDGTPLKDTEVLLRYRMRGRPQLGAESYFFQEGHAEHYQGARYGELRVSKSGDAVLVGLRDAGRRPMGPARS